MQRVLKKGVTNVEIVISSTLFIFSVVLSIYYLTFVAQSLEPTESWLNSLENNIRREAEIRYEIIHLKLKDGLQGTCFNLSLFNPNKKPVIVTSLDNRLTPFRTENDNLLLKDVNNEREFIIYLLPIDQIYVTPISESCTLLTKGEDYNYSLVGIKDVFYYNNLSTISNLDYNYLKRKWNFQRDFRVNISGTNLVFGGVKPPLSQIEVKQVPINILKIDEQNNRLEFINTIAILEVW